MTDTPLNTTSRNQPGPIRRWSDWLLGLSLFLAPILLAAWVGFAGERVNAWFGWGCSLGYSDVSLAGSGNFGVEIWEHGWPFVFLERYVDLEASHPFAIWHGDLAFGYASLIADLAVFGAIVGTSVLLFRCKQFVSLPRRRVSISLRCLLAIVTVFCLMAASLGQSHIRSQREMAIGAKLEQLGHQVTFGYVGPRWFSRLGGRDLAWCPMQGVTEVYVSDDAAEEWPEGALEAGIAELASLQVLNLDSSQTSDDVLTHLLAARRQWTIQEISFAGAPITGKAFVDCRSLPQLRKINAGWSKLGDNGFAALTTLPRIEEINAEETNVSNESIKYALQAPHLRYVKFQYTAITQLDCRPLIEQGVECEVDPDVATQD